MMKIKRAGAWAICWLALWSVGCASGVDGMRQAIGNTAFTVAAGYRTLGKVDAVVQAKIQTQAKTDPKAASAALDAHIKRYDVARLALDAAADMVESANAAVPLVEKGIAGNKDPAAWIADLIAVGLTVTNTLHDLGVM